ncbi:MAG: NADPH-dependent FMN reductase [Chitinophagales bacterium]
MKKIIAIGGSTSSKSINKALAHYVASQVNSVTVENLDMRDFDMPMYSEDAQADNGIPQLAKDLSEAIKSCDGIVLSLAEHNGHFPAAFKNITDWLSVVDGSDMWHKKPMYLLGTSPGPRGAINVLEYSLKLMPFLGANIVAHFSLPSFNTNFSLEEGVKDEELKTQFLEQLALYQAAL